MLWSPEESHSTVSPSAFPHPLTHLRKGFFNFSHPPLHCLLPRVTFGFNWGHTQGRVCSVSTAENQSMISRFFLFPLLAVLVSNGQLLLLLLLLPVVRCRFWALPVGPSRPWAGNSFLMLLSSWLLHLPHLVTWLLHCLCNYTSVLIILYLNA